MAKISPPPIKRVLGSISSEREQYLVYFGVSVVVLCCTLVLYFSERQVFQRFLAKIDPLMIFVIAIIVGFILLSFFLKQNWFAIYEKRYIKDLLPFMGLAALLGFIMIIIDTRIIFAADTNILFPQSLLFYPAIGFFVEILFHVFPLALLIPALSSILKNLSFNTICWISIVIISVVEPIYHIIPMVSSKEFPLWAVTYVGIHIFLINFIQLVIFKKYDFISMFSFRLVYYLFWHIVWGYFRLYLLF